MEEKELELNHEYRLQQMETTYLGDLQRRTDIAENERHHHENQIERQMIERQKEGDDFQLKHADLREKFQHEKQRIGMLSKVHVERRIDFRCLFSFRGRRSRSNGPRIT